MAKILKSNFQNILHEDNNKFDTLKRALFVCLNHRVAIGSTADILVINDKIFDLITSD